jgi:hypothetical protein
MIEGVLLGLAIRRGGDLPRSSPSERYRLSPLDPRPKDQFGILAISRPISMQITADLPCSGELGIRVLPSQVTEMHGVLALVCQHKGVERAGGVGVIPSRRPHAANARTGVEDCDMERAAGDMV